MSDLYSQTWTYLQSLNFEKPIQVFKSLLYYLFHKIVYKICDHGVCLVI